MNMYQIMWIIAMIVLTIVELCTFNMITIWFVLGALAAFIASVAGVGVSAQLWIFVIVSLLMLAVTYPVVSKKLMLKKTSTNADRLIGMKGVVTDEITSVKFAGKVSINGQEWSAIEKNGTNVEEGEIVKITEINGVKLVVEKE